MDLWLFCFLIAGLPCCIGCIIVLLTKFCCPHIGGTETSDTFDYIQSNPSYQTAPYAPQYNTELCSYHPPHCEYEWTPYSQGEYYSTKCDTGGYYTPHWV